MANAIAFLLSGRYCRYKNLSAGFHYIEILEIDNIAAAEMTESPCRCSITFRPEFKSFLNGRVISLAYITAVLECFIVYVEFAFIYNSVSLEFQSHSVFMIFGIIGIVALLEFKPVANLHRGNIPVIIFEIGGILFKLKVIEDVAQVNVNLIIGRRSADYYVLSPLRLFLVLAAGTQHKHQQKDKIYSFSQNTFLRVSSREKLFQ